MEDLIGSVIGAVAVVAAAEAISEAITEFAVMGALADIANIMADGKIDEDEEGRLLDDIAKLVVGAIIIADDLWGNHGKDDSSDPYYINKNFFKIGGDRSTKDEADQYINTNISVFGTKIPMGRKTYFANEISDLPKEISYESSGYTYIYKLQEIPITEGVFGSDPVYGWIITTKDGTVINNKEYAYVLSYTDEPQMSIGIISALPPEMPVEGIGGKVAVNEAVEGESNAVDVELKYKDGWTDAQKAEADAKIKALSEADTVKTAPNRKGTSASSRYKKVNGPDSVPSGNDVDHTIDLQLGGADDILNMNPLDASVNRSLGKQIQNKIKDYPIGTKFGDFAIK